VLIDDLHLYNGILDPGKQAHQFFGIWAIEPKLAITCSK
jgi:hypothetical protein